MENINNSTVLAREAVKILLEKKGIAVALFDVREKSSVTDYYINVTGRSSSQVAALADDVDVKLSELGRSPLRTEGKRGNGWILVDFGDVIINVFDRASRAGIPWPRSHLLMACGSTCSLSASCC